MGWWGCPCRGGSYRRGHEGWSLWIADYTGSNDVFLWKSTTQGLRNFVLISDLMESRCRVSGKKSKIILFSALKIFKKSFFQEKFE